MPTFSLIERNGLNPSHLMGILVGIEKEPSGLHRLNAVSSRSGRGSASGLTRNGRVLERHRGVPVPYRLAPAVACPNLPAT